MICDDCDQVLAKKALVSLLADLDFYCFYLFLNGGCDKGVRILEIRHKGFLRL